MKQLIETLENVFNCADAHVYIQEVMSSAEYNVIDDDGKTSTIEVSFPAVKSPTHLWHFQMFMRRLILDNQLRVGAIVGFRVLNARTRREPAHLERATNIAENVFTLIRNIQKLRFPSTQPKSHVIIMRQMTPGPATVGNSEFLSGESTFAPINHDTPIFTALEPTELFLYYRCAAGRVELEENVDKLPDDALSATPIISYHTVRDKVGVRLSGRQLILTTTDLSFGPVRDLISRQFQPVTRVEAPVSLSPEEENYVSNAFFEDRVHILTTQVLKTPAHRGQWSKLLAFLVPGHEVPSVQILEKGVKQKVILLRSRYNAMSYAKISLAEAVSAAALATGVTVDVANLILNFWTPLFKEVG